MWLSTNLTEASEIRIISDANKSNDPTVIVSVVVRSTRKSRVVNRKRIEACCHKRSRIQIMFYLVISPICAPICPNNGAFTCLSYLNTPEEI